MQRYINPIGIVNGIKVFEYQATHMSGIESYAVIAEPDRNIKKVKLFEDRIPDHWYFKIGNNRHYLNNMSRNRD